MKKEDKDQHKGDKWKELRQETGLTQRAFSEMMQIPLRTYQEWEHGRQSPPDYLFDLCRRILDTYMKKEEDE